MARLCQLCERGSNRGNSRSHSNIATKRQQFANLQTRRVGNERIKMCTTCLKTLKTKMAQAQA